MNVLIQVGQIIIDDLGRWKVGSEIKVIRIHWGGEKCMQPVDICQGKACLGNARRQKDVTPTKEKLEEVAEIHY